MKKSLFTFLATAIACCVNAQCPTFSLASSTNFSIDCPYPGQSTLSIINAVSTQTPPATVSYTFLPPGSNPATLSPTGVLGNNTTQTIAVSGVWYAIVRDNSNFCTTTKTVMITGGGPYFTMQQTNASGACDGSITISTHTLPANSYSISSTSGTVSGNNITNLCPGMVTICLTDTATGCQYCDSTNITIGTWISERDQQAGFTVYPNPAQHSFMIKNISQLLATITVFSYEGKILKTITLKEKEEAVVKDLSAGIYVAELKTPQGIQRKKIVLLD